jgi:hypothetical protein
MHTAPPSQPPKGLINCNNKCVLRCVQNICELDSASTVTDIFLQHGIWIKMSFSVGVPNILTYTTLKDYNTAGDMLIQTNIVKLTDKFDW